MTASLRRDGVEGNRRLTAMLGAVLLVLLAIEGGTIPFLSSLEVVHVVVGLILIPVVLLKLGRRPTGSRVTTPATPSTCGRGRRSWYSAPSGRSSRLRRRCCSAPAWRWP